MNLMWILVAVPLASLLYFAWVVGRQKPTLHAISFAPGSPSPVASLREPLRGKRTVKWISSSELEGLVRKFEDVILVDLLLENGKGAPPSSGPRTLIVGSDQLCEVLRWALPSTCVVLYGPLDLCKSMLKAAKGMEGHAALFILPVSSKHS